MPAGLFIGLLIFFLFSVMGTVPGGDSSMFIGAAFSTGVAQPPGYPLITLIYKLLFFFPLDSILLINFSSAVFTSLSSLTLFFLFKEIIKCKYSAFILALFFSTLPLIFRYSLVAEVFALNNFLISLTLFLAFKYQLSKNIRLAYIGVFTMGLGMSHHHSFLFVALPLIIWLLVNHKELRALRILLQLFAFGLLGLSPYLYLFIAPANAGPITWGETNSWIGFVHHFLRKDFGTFQLTAKGAGGLLPNLWAFLSDLPKESFLLLYLLPGLWFFKKIKNFKADSFAHLILATLLIYLFIFFSLSNIDLSNNLFKEVFLRFWQLPLLLLTILSAYGIKEIPIQYKKSAFFIITLFVLLRGGLSFYDHGRSKLTIFEDYSLAMLDSLPKDAVLIATGDLQVNILRFQQVVKKKRSDLVILPVPLMNLSWYKKIHRRFKPSFKLPPGVYGPLKKAGKYQLLDLYKVNPQRKFFMLQDHSLVKKESTSDLSMLKEFNWVPHGFLFELVPKNIAIDPIKVINSHELSKKQFQPNHYKRLESGSWEELVSEVIFWNAERYHMIFHTRLLKQKDSIEHRKALAQHIEKLRETFGSIPPEFLKNLGLLYYQLIGNGLKMKQPLLSAWGEYYKNLEDKTNAEALEIKKALDHFGKN